MMLENQDQLIDIYDMWYEPFWTQTWFVALFITAIILMSAALLYVVYKKYWYRKPVVNCAQVALDRLQYLKNFSVYHKADSKECYFQLSLIIKEYLASRYHTVHFLQMTDQEIIAQASVCMPQDAVEIVQKLLQDMTLVKFERAYMLVERFHQDIDLVEQLIHKTTVAEQIKEK